ncbi:MAG: hypothetical protein AB7O31_16025 [Burkholderiales bacterium]
MGLKDWFGGGKKKEQFREAVKEAVSDGKLTDEKRAELETLRAQLDADPGDDKTQLRREVYNVAVGAVKAGGKLTTTEEQELARIQEFLNLKDEQVDKTRMDLRRLRVVTEINKGNLPTVSPEHTALKGLALDPGEAAHYTVAAESFDAGELGTAIGSRFVFGSAFRPGIGRAFALPLKGATSNGQGVFILTSQRFIFRGPKSFGVKHRQPDEIYLYRDGIRLKMKKSQALLQIRDESVIDIVGAILAKLSSAA